MVDVFFKPIPKRSCRDEYNGYSVHLSYGYERMQSAELGNYIEYKKQLTDHAHRLAISYQTKFEQAECIVVKSPKLIPSG